MCVCERVRFAHNFYGTNVRLKMVFCCCCTHGVPCTYARYATFVFEHATERGRHMTVCAWIAWIFMRVYQSTDTRNTTRAHNSSGVYARCTHVVDEGVLRLLSLCQVSPSVRHRWRTSISGGFDVKAISPCIGAGLHKRRKESERKFLHFNTSNLRSVVLCRNNREANVW